MSFDEYALTIAQKYRVAISIAILKTKPENKGIDEYLTEIKNVIINNNMQDELNISACSGDFDIDCSGEVNDLNDQNCIQNGLSRDEINEIEENENDFDETQFNDNGIHMNDNWIQDNVNTGDNIKRTGESSNIIQDFDNRTKDNDNGTEVNEKRRQDLNNCITILNNFEDTYQKTDVNTERRDKFREVINVLKGVDVTATDKVIINDIHKHTCENIQNKPFDPMGMDITQCYGDNDNTFLENIETLTYADWPISYEHSCSQNNIENTQCTILHKSENQNTSQQFRTEANANQVNSNTTGQEDIRKRKKLPINDEMDVLKPKLIKMIHSVENNTIYLTKANSNTTEISNAHTCLQATRNKHKNIASIPVNMEVIDRKETLTVPDTQFNTHFSESQMNAVIINNNLIYGSKINDAYQDIGKNAEISEVFSQSSQEIFNKAQSYETADVINENVTVFSIDIQNGDTQTHSRIENDIAFSQNAQMMDSLNGDVNTETHIDNYLENGIECSKTLFEKNFVNDTSNDKFTVFDKVTEKTGSFINTDANTNDTDEDLTDDQIEKIPFKIIEEMNQIKTYLNKRKEIRDTGFFGSSQSKCSLKSTQSSNILVGESAYSVFYYLASCPLVTATQDLTEQISELLGQLIDRLHEDEIYPPFLEELLNAVEKLLKLVCEEENYDFDVLLKKDEQTQRIILLSKSIHITKFTIEKVNGMLQKLLDDISVDDAMYEILNINKIENICYIFHILQVIIPKYSLKSQASTQNSQDDEKVQRKRDISDIWRKKWISNFKEESNEGSSENKCVLKDCSAILNKIIVNFMDGYSLIAFSALKCFNLMQ